MKKENRVNMSNRVGNWFVNLVAIAGVIILGIWIFQGLEYRSTNPKTEITLVGGEMSKYKMLSCTTHVMLHSDSLKEAEYAAYLKLCTDNHVSKELAKGYLELFSKEPSVTNAYDVSYKITDLKKSEQAVAEMLNKLKTNTKEK